MTFKEFKNKINGIIARSEENIAVWFSYDKSIRKYYARFSDGTIITGHPSGNKITVRYGSGHQMMAAI